MSSSNDTPSLFVTPQTPPRQQQRRKSNTGAISTPVASSVLLTPSTTTKTYKNSSITEKKQGVQLSPPQANKFPFTPITPQNHHARQERIWIYSLVTKNLAYCYHRHPLLVLVDVITLSRKLHLHYLI